MFRLRMQRPSPRSCARTSTPKAACTPTKANSTRVGEEFAAHETVNHSAKEYARGDVTTNTVEGYFSIFKRGMRGNYQHCAEKHLHRYLAEFDFRYNTRNMTDGERAVLAVQGGEGKRLTYRQPS